MGSTTLSKAEYISKVGIFSDLMDQEIDSFSKAVGIRNLDRGDSLIRADENSCEVYFIFSGRFRVRRFLVYGREIIFSDLFAGSIFGEYAALDLAPRSTDVVAVESSSVGVMRDDAFREMLLQHPKVCLKLAANLARVARSSLQRIVDLTALNPFQRVCRELLELTENQNPEEDLFNTNRLIVITGVPSQSVIASKVATSRESVSRALSDLEQQKIIRRINRSSWQIQDLHRLRELISDGHSLSD